MARVRTPAYAGTLGTPQGEPLGLGLIWGLWHLPLFVFVKDYDNADPGFVATATMFVVFTGCYTVGLSVIFTWLVNHARGSILLAMLAHGSCKRRDELLAPKTALPLMVSFMAIAILALVIASATHGQLGYTGRPVGEANRSKRGGQGRASRFSGVLSPRHALHRAARRGPDEVQSDCRAITDGNIARALAFACLRASRTRGIGRLRWTSGKRADGPYSCSTWTSMCPSTGTAYALVGEDDVARCCRSATVGRSPPSKDGMSRDLLSSSADSPRRPVDRGA